MNLLQSNSQLIKRYEGDDIVEEWQHLVTFVVALQ